MSDVFDDTLKAAAESFFKLPGYERILYRPRTGAVRAIKAVVTRNTAENLPGVAGGSGPAFEVLVKNDDTEGIYSQNLDTGGDELDIAPNVGEPPGTFRITELINHDAGLMLLAAS